MRPMPASRFQLTPHAGAASAIFCSALRYAASAIVGIRIEPGELTTLARGGAVTMAAA